MEKGKTNLTLKLITILGAEDDDEIMGDDGLLGGTTTVDDLKISGNISNTNTSIIGGKFDLLPLALF